MKLKAMPLWFKGGLIGAGVALLLMVIELYLLWTKGTLSEVTRVGFYLFPSWYPSMPHWISTLLFTGFRMVRYLLIGTLIGFLIQFFKDQKKNEPMQSKDNLVQTGLWLFWITLISFFWLSLWMMITLQYHSNPDLHVSESWPFICSGELGREVYEGCSLKGLTFQILFFAIVGYFADFLNVIFSWPTLISGVFLFLILETFEYKSSKKKRWRRWIFLVFPLFYSGLMVLIQGAPKL